MRVTIGEKTRILSGLTMASLILSPGDMSLPARALRSFGLPVSLRKRAAFLSRMRGAYDSLRVKKVKMVIRPARMAMSQ
jgi:hypothetical protein